MHSTTSASSTVTDVCRYILLYSTHMFHVEGSKQGKQSPVRYFL
jgi:hypothetical protein